MGDEEEEEEGEGRMKTLPRWGSQWRWPEMKVISSKIAARAVETSSGEILCWDKYSKLSTLAPSITNHQQLQTRNGVKRVGRVHSMTKMRFLAQIMSGIFNNEPGIFSKCCLVELAFSISFSKSSS